jgi:predicted transcriptional regulator
MEVPMPKVISGQIEDELHAKIKAEAEQKKCSVSDVLREKIELAYARDEIINLKQTIAEMDKKILELTPQIRRAENLSWWTLTVLAEYLKRAVAPERFREIERISDEKYADYLKTRDLKL